MNARPIRAWLSRALAPNLSYCSRCRTSFWGPIRNEHHTTYYEEGSGCFPLCEECWSALTPATRVWYYDDLVNRWIAETPWNAAEYEQKRELIHAAVLSEAAA